MRVQTMKKVALMLWFFRVSSITSIFFAQFQSSIVIAISVSVRFQRINACVYSCIISLYGELILSGSMVYASYEILLFSASVSVSSVISVIFEESVFVSKISMSFLSVLSVIVSLFSLKSQDDRAREAASQTVSGNFFISEK
jgi:hypothetical protein